MIIIYYPSHSKKIKNIPESQKSRDYALLQEYLNARGGWTSYYKVKFLPGSLKDADLTITFEPPEEIGASFVNSDMSYTNLLDSSIHLNYKNWLNSTPAYIGSYRQHRPSAKDEEILREYRRYLVNHEMGHALGESEHRNDACSRPRSAPIMMQQTRGTKGCAPSSNIREDELSKKLLVRLVRKS